MALSTNTVLFFILSCDFWVAEARQYNSMIAVRNGGRWGQWGHPQFCSKGHALGFRLKVEPLETAQDSTALNGIALLCDDGGTVTSTVGPWGIWQKVQYCCQGHLIGFTLRVQEEVSGDNTAANNIVALCSDNTLLFGKGVDKGRFGQTRRCRNGSICGLVTKVQPQQLEGDDTALNDVKMFCCD